MSGWEVGKPKWKVWRHIPNLALWEGVALSMDMEPAEVGYNFADLTAMSARFPVWQEYLDRLMVAARNIGPNGNLSMARITSADPGTPLVPRHEFAAWVCSLDWQVPAEFDELSRPPHEQSVTPTPTSHAGRATTAQPALTGWKEAAIAAYQELAREHPGENDEQLADRVAARLQVNEVRGRGNKFLKATTIRRHALQGVQRPAVSGGKETREERRERRERRKR